MMGFPYETRDQPRVDIMITKCLTIWEARDAMSFGS